MSFTLKPQREIKREHFFCKFNIESFNQKSTHAFCSYVYPKIFKTVLKCSKCY